MRKESIFNKRGKFRKQIVALALGNFGQNLVLLTITKRGRTIPAWRYAVRSQMSYNWMCLEGLFGILRTVSLAFGIITPTVFS